MDGLTARERLLVTLAGRLAADEMVSDELDDYAPSADEAAAFWHLVAFFRDLERQRRERQRRADRVARRLLRSYLSAGQRRQLSRTRCFHLEAASGTVYRLQPLRATVERVERHGGRWFARESYCLHDYAEDTDGERLPPSDVSLSHLLLILSDEPAFLAAANVTDRRDELWNGAYLRRLRARRAA